MTMLAIVLGVAVLAIGVLNRRAFGRVFGAGSAQVGKLGRWAQNKDPLAILQEKIDDAADNLRNAKDGLDQANGMVLSLTRQVEFCTKEKAKLETRIKTALNEGRESDAKNYAVQLAKVETDLETNTAQLSAAQKGLDNIVKQIKLHQRKFQEAKQDAIDLGVQLKMSKAEADMAGMFEQIGTMNAPLSDLGEARNAVTAQIDANRGKLQTAMQLNETAVQEMKDDEAAESAAANDILARFRQTQ